MSGSLEEPFDREGVRGILHRPAFPTGDAMVLAHGASSDHRAPLLARLGTAMADAGFVVLRYDLPFRRQRTKGPPTPAASARDREGIVQAIQAMSGFATGRLFAGGHSYGGRQTAMIAAERPQLAAGLLLLSYPLHPPGKPEQKRTSFFPEFHTPALFVHGTSDPFGSIEELREAISLIPARTDLLAVERAGHDLKRAADLSGEMLERLRAVVCYPGK